MNEDIHALKFSYLKENIHPALIKLMSFKTTGDLTVEGEFPKNGNYLIVANHYCIEDIPTLAEATKEHFYLLVSDEDKNTLDGLALELNGVEWVHRTDSVSRKQVSENIVKMLKQGKNVAMYPEATWNLSPNQLMMPMNYGCIRMALQASVDIVPVVTYFADNKRYTKIGEPYHPNKILSVSITELRDRMATMMYELMEKNYKENFLYDNNIYVDKSTNNYYYFEKRDNLKSGIWDNNIYDRYNSYERAKKDMPGVREFESQFIFTSKDDSEQFFQEYNSIVSKDENGNMVVRRITSERNGYNGLTFGEEKEKSSFGYGYNEKVLKKELKK